MGYVFDPICRFNVHGAVICFQVSHTLATMFEAAGLKGRVRGLPGHQVTEAFYAGAWHLFDAQVDCASYFLGDDGDVVLDADTVCKDSARYILRQRRPSDPFFQHDRHGGKFVPWENKRYCAEKFYRPGAASVYVANHHSGHTMHMDLRRGEKLIRNWDSAGRWVCTVAMYRRHHVGGKPFYDVSRGCHDMRDLSNHYANGVLVYEPDWAAGADNFLDGLYEGCNYVLTDGAVHPAGPGECHVILRVQTPYLIAGKPGKLDTDGDSTDGALLRADLYRKSARETAAVCLSTDNGLTWRTVYAHDGVGKRQVRLDLTNHVEGRYGYLLRFRLLADKPADAALSNVKLTNWLFLSPVLLPALKPGKNDFIFTHHPRRAVFWIRPDLSTQESCERFFHELRDLKYDTHYTRCLTPTGPGNTGHAVVLVRPPAGWKVRRLSVLGMFGTRGTSDAAEVLCRTRDDGEWTLACDKRFERGVHWRQDRTADIRLPAPADRCYVQFRLKRVGGHCSLNNYRVYAHCTRPELPLPAGAVKVTHHWTADGRECSRTVRPDVGGGRYVVEAAGKDVRNRSLVIEVANDRPGRP